MRRDREHIRHTRLSNDDNENKVARNIDLQLEGDGVEAAKGYKHVDGVKPTLTMLPNGLSAGGGVFAPISPMSKMTS